MIRNLLQRSIFVISILLINTSSFCQGSTEATRYLPVVADGKWGYINQKAEEVIPFKYDEAEYFSNNWARVKTGKGYYFIDSKGNTVLEPEVGYVASFNEGLAVASRPGSKKLGYINKAGKFVIDPQFEKAFSFSEGKAAVYSEENDGFGYINKTGEFVIAPRFDGARKFVNGLAPALTGGFVFGKWGYIDTTGSFVLEPQYSGALPFSEGLAAVNKETGMDDNWGYINPKGQMIIEPDGYVTARVFSGGLAAVKHGGFGWRFINPQGKPVIRRVNGREELKFAEPFHGQWARVSLDGLDGMGHQGGTMNFSVRGAEWIVIDKTGKKVWPGPQAVTKPAPIKAPKGFEAFQAEWPHSFFSIAYPLSWWVTDLNQRTGMVEGVSFVKNKKAAQTLYKGGDINMTTGQKVNLVTDGNVIINVAVQPQATSKMTPKEFIEMMEGKTMINNPGEDSIKTTQIAQKPVTTRTITGIDEEGRKIASVQIATKTKGRIISISALKPASSGDKEIQGILATMLENMKVGPK